MNYSSSQVLRRVLSARVSCPVQEQASRVLCAACKAPSGSAYRSSATRAWSTTGGAFGGRSVRSVSILVRRLSSAPTPPPRPAGAAAAEAGGATATKGAAEASVFAPPRPAVPPPESANVFVRHAGKTFLAVLGLVGLYFYHSKRGTDAHFALVDSLEDRTALSPGEMKQLREANSITTEQFVELALALLDEHPEKASFEEFDRSFGTKLRALHPELHYAHHLERVLASLTSKGLDGVAADLLTEEVDTRLLLVASSLAVSGDVEERLNALLRVFAGREGGHLSHQQLVDLVGASRRVGTYQRAPCCVVFRLNLTVALVPSTASLCKTWQLPAEFQVKKVSDYPFPTWERKSAKEMVDDGLREDQLP